ncbi:Cell death protease [Quaeritorhiza haematococci]|nr:Cell death protease [Quaeritorhiza haematococci]
MDIVNNRISLGVSVTVRITLKDGAFHEDIGFGSIDNAKSKSQAYEKVKKEAATDALKRALKAFGLSTGNCLYDKQYIKEIQRMKMPTAPPMNANNLYRAPDFRNVGVPTIKTFASEFGGNKAAMPQQIKQTSTTNYDKIVGVDLESVDPSFLTESSRQSTSPSGQQQTAMPRTTPKPIPLPQQRQQQQNQSHTNTATNNNMMKSGSNDFRQGKCSYQHQSNDVNPNAGALVHGSNQKATPQTKPNTASTHAIQQQQEVMTAPTSKPSPSTSIMNRGMSSGFNRQSSNNRTVSSFNQPAPPSPSMPGNPVTPKVTMPSTLNSNGGNINSNNTANPNNVQNPGSMAQSPFQQPPQSSSSMSSAGNGFQTHRSPPQPISNQVQFASGNGNGSSIQQNQNNGGNANMAGRAGSHFGMNSSNNNNCCSSSFQGGVNNNSNTARSFSRNSSIENLRPLSNAEMQNGMKRRYV